ncbi:MAG TPA: tRNA adenosine(34) deaminase TadA [Vicinamibacteria bacterium]|nr:tRNA adenosine(34) deaminase TadA [Vicinamibacteria bacterium]
MTAHEPFMRLALARAREALAGGEVPIGAVVVAYGRVVGEGSNQTISARDPTAHAEVLALRQAATTLGNYRLAEATLYVTVEPCLMCAGAAVNARIAHLVYGTDEPKFGAIRSVMRLAELGLNHQLQVSSGVLEEECRGLLVGFFRERRSRRALE